MKRPGAWFVIGFVVFLAIISIGLYYAGVGFFNKYAASSEKQPAAVQCTKKGTTHYVIIRSNSIQPVHTTAKLCDTLTVTNQDATLRLLAFGPHEHHQPYDGITEQVLDQGNSLTVTLNQAGIYTFHDHLNDTLIGTFSVTQ